MRDRKVIAREMSRTRDDLERNVDELRLAMRTKVDDARSFGQRAGRIGKLVALLAVGVAVAWLWRRRAATSRRLSASWQTRRGRW